MKLTVGDDFKPIYLLFSRVKKQFPQHLSSTLKIQKSVDQLIDEYKHCLWHYSRTQRPAHLDRAQKKLDAISNLLTVLEKQELMAILSGGAKKEF